MRYELFPQAALELLNARGIDPKHPRLALVERRLALLAAIRDAESRPAGAGSLGPSARSPQRPENEPTGDDPAGDEPVGDEPAVDTLPEGALELFTRRVQPILVNNCTTTGCHGEADGSRFRLSRALLYGESNRRTTARNLSAVLAQIERERVERSPLLHHAIRTHGEMERPVFGAHRRDLYEQLVSWAQLISEEGIPVAPPQQVAAPASPNGRVVPASAPMPQRGAYRGPRIRFGAPLRSGVLSPPVDADAVSRAIDAHNRSVPDKPAR